MESLDLYQLFSGRIFRIPDYQRGYAWEERQLVEFWDDINEVSYEDGTSSKFKPHYTGTIYLEEIEPEPADKWLTGVKHFHVVDGQQRLTTISIFIFELLKLESIGYSEKSTNDLKKQFLYESNLSGNCRAYRFSYERVDPNNKYLKRIIYEDSSEVVNGDEISAYKENLWKAKKFFSGKLFGTKQDEREILFTKLTTSLRFDVRLMEKDLDVQAVFETMNNRGKPLSTLEKLKNRLIYLSVKLNGISPEDREKLRKHINDAWRKIYAYLGKNPNNMLD